MRSYGNMVTLNFITKLNYNSPFQISIVGLASYFIKKIQAILKNYHLTTKFTKNHLYLHILPSLQVQCTNYLNFYLRLTLLLILWIPSTITNSETMFLLFIVSFLSAHRNAHILKGKKQLCPFRTEF